MKYVGQKCPCNDNIFNGNIYFFLHWHPYQINYKDDSKRIARIMDINFVYTRGILKISWNIFVNIIKLLLFIFFTFQNVSGDKLVWCFYRSEVFSFGWSWITAGWTLSETIAKKRTFSDLPFFFLSFLLQKLLQPSRELPGELEQAEFKSVLQTWFRAIRVAGVGCQYVPVPEFPWENTVKRHPSRMLNYTCR